MRSLSSFSYKEAFDKKFPYFLSLGMTPEQYWDGDASLTRAYLELDKIRQERENYRTWLQGMYIYDALGRLAPVFQAFGKKGAKAQPYPDRPYPLDEEEIEQRKQEAEKKKMEKGKRYLQNLKAQNDLIFEKQKQQRKEGDKSCRNQRLID